MIIGIDLGTTFSAAAHMTSDGPRLIPNALGDNLTPSVVGFDKDDTVFVGSAAKELAVLHPDRCAAVFKRYMGSSWKVRLGKRDFTAEELSSLILRSLKQDAEAHLGSPVDSAVITVPAYFNDNQRKATIRAGQLAGLAVERIFNEPTAAAIAYGLHEAGEEKVIAVFDLGGGTFDVSIVDLFDGAVEVRASSGEAFLGGEDFTQTLAARVLESRGIVFERAELETPALVARVLQQCEAAKRLLSRQATAQVRIPNRDGQYVDPVDEVQISRDDFTKWTEHILARVELPIRRAIGDAKLNRTDITEVILVGGATRMPTVVQRVTEIFQKEPRSRLNPDEVVALGAAVQAGLVARESSLDDLVVTDVSPFTLGVEISKQIGTEYRGGYFLPIISRNTTIPVSRVQRLSTLQANQTQLRVGVYQGEARRTEDNLLLDDFVVQGIPRGPAGQEIDIRFTYDLNGVLEVEATVVETKRKVSVVITKHARGVSPAEIERAVAAMAAIKTHPREETANRFLIKRAERIYQELSVFHRDHLAELLDGFESVLDLQDRAAIDRYRNEMEIFLSQFELRESAGDDDDAASE
jgi:molecular chaperone HscC